MVDPLVDLLEQAVAVAEFQTDGGRNLSSAELREGLLEDHWGGPARRAALSARTHTHDEVISRLVEYLRGRLAGYINAETGQVGHSFRVAGDQGGSVTGRDDFGTVIQAASDLDVLAKGLVRLGAISGPTCAKQLLGEWADGGPFGFTVCFVLDGVYIGGPLELDIGLRAYPLAVSSDGLPLSMPQVDANHIVNLLGHCVLEFDASTSPALFVPPHWQGKFPGSKTVTVLGDVPVELFLTALSLVCNTSVRVGWRWTDYRQAAGLAVGNPGGIAGHGPARLTQLSRGYTQSLESNIVELTDLRLPAVNLQAHQLWRAWELVPELQRRMNEDTRFRIAVTRWSQSQLRGAEPEDRAVDLRIALESLYLDSSGGELGFRLAVTGARHLGVDLEERRRIRKELADFYGVASRVVHGVEVKEMKASDQNCVAVAGARCRDAILQIVETKCRPDWTDLLLS